MRTSQHVEAVRQKFPQLRTIVEKPWCVIWEGTLMGFDQPYKVQIFWTRWSPWDDMSLSGRVPRVYVMDPPLEDRDETYEGMVPHLYERASGKPFLCLYDPEEEGWEDNERSIADTIIPWASSWLATYELWRVTGKWLAPGRHQEAKEECKETQNEIPNPDQQARSIAAANAYLGRKIGTFASYPLMAAASEESYRWLSWRDWSKPTFKESLLQAISTSSPVHLLAVLSLSALAKDSLLPKYSKSTSNVGAKYFPLLTGGSDTSNLPQNTSSTAVTAKNLELS